MSTYEKAVRFIGFAYILITAFLTPITLGISLLSGDPLSDLGIFCSGSFILTTLLIIVVMARKEGS